MARVSAALLFVFAFSATPIKAQQYDANLADRFAALAQAAYCITQPQTQQQLQDWTCGPCQQSGLDVVPGSVRVVNHEELNFGVNSTSLYVMRLSSIPWSTDVSDGCVVSVRGSSDWANWVVNLEAWPQPIASDWCQGCEVEAGFWSVWSDVQDQVVAALSDIGCVANPVAEGQTRNVWVTGHSMGGAVSTAGMFVLQTLGYSVQQSFTYEAPRLGNQEFADAFADLFGRAVPTWRITHAKDPVPHVPMFDLGYRHVSTEVYYADDSGAYKICDGSGEDQSCADTITWVTSLSHGDDHCDSPLVSNGNICRCDSGSTHSDVMV